ncbi:MAG: hypothetical protein AUG49_09345 [Catenulispora sp. 13_1_20CM_3_70_7]|nr:MAG: hypothetical protein AUG49_09345 [Catenulispora sp. 13_1_20CM_3_70_7]
MSKVTPSARRRVSVAAGTVGLAAVGAAMCAGQASAAESGLPGLAGGGLPLSTNALAAVKGLTAHNPDQVAGLPLAGLPVLGQVPAVLDTAAPAARTVPGLSGAVGAPQGAAASAASAALAGQSLAQRQMRSRATKPGHNGGGHNAVHPASAPAKAPAAAPATAAPAATPATIRAPAASVGATPMTVPVPAAALPAPAKAGGPLGGVTGALPMQLPLSGLEQSVPLGGQLTGPGGKGLPVVGGLAGGLPLLGSGAGSGSPLDGLPLAGLTGGLGHLAG